MEEGGYVCVYICLCVRVSHLWADVSGSARVVGVWAGLVPVLYHTGAPSGEQTLGIAASPL